MSIIFLDYYEPFAGLCNQLYLITNHIHLSILNNSQIYINKVNIDIFKKHRIPAYEFFDLKKTICNIEKLTGISPILIEKPLSNFYIPDLCIFPVSSIPILNCLEFNSKYTSLVPEIKDYYGLHFRVDVDSIIHYLFKKECYEDFMNKCNNGTLSEVFLTNFMESVSVKNYIQYLLHQYFVFLYQLGLQNTWYISTTIGKNDINEVLLPVLNTLTNFIETNGGKVMLNKKNFEYRELNALVDLLTLRDSTKLIVFEGSSFSEGYCLKVNSIRNPNKEYRIVNGIIPKLPNEIYFNY